ncbi:uncharacterized protein V6R79_003115, partial [Siganus canaliculatus]
PRPGMDLTIDIGESRSIFNKELIHKQGEIKRDMIRCLAGKTGKKQREDGEELSGKDRYTWRKIGIEM